jgi:hypothetical protein
VSLSNECLNDENKLQGRTHREAEKTTEYELRRGDEMSD